MYQAHTQHSLWAWGVLGCMNISFKSITQYWLTFLLSVKFYLWHYFVYWLQQLQNNRLPPPNGLNDVPEAVALLYPEGTYWLLYKLLSAYIISFLHCHHKILPTFPYSNTFHLAAHMITNCFLFTPGIDKIILIWWFRSPCCSIPTALKCLRQSKMKGNMRHSVKGPLLIRITIDIQDGLAIYSICVLPEFRVTQTS